MKDQEKKELFADFEAMIDSITEVAPPADGPDGREEAPAFDKEQFAAVLAKKSTLLETAQFCLQSVTSAAGEYAAAFYVLDPAEGGLHLITTENTSPAVANSITGYESNSIVVRRVMSGKPTFKNFLGISILDEVETGEDAPSIVAVLPVHFKYKVVGSIHLLSSSQEEVPDRARYAMQTIAALSGDAVARFIKGDIPKLARRIRAEQRPAPNTPPPPAEKTAPSPKPQTAPAKAPPEKPAPPPEKPGTKQQRQAAETRVKAHAVSKAQSATDLLINSIPAFTFVMTMDGRIAYLNRYTLDRLGYPKQEIIGSFITSLYPTGKQYTNLDRKYAILEHQEGDINYLLQSKSGTVYGVRFSVHRSRFNKKEAVICIGHEERTHHRGDDKPLGDKLESLSHELHQLKIEMEELRNYSESEEKKKEAFIEKVSYEIRSMLNAVIGMTGLLFETDLDNEQIEYVETIHRSGDSMLEHINEIIESLNFNPNANSESESYYNRFLSAEMAEEISGVSIAGKRVLLVDEERGNRTTIKRELEQIGWNVTAVATVAEARDLIAKRGALDAAVIDLNISRGDPETLARDIRRAYPEDALFLILITGEEYDQSIAGELGSAMFMQKPYDIDLMRYRLAKFLASQQAKHITKIPAARDRQGPLKILLVEDNHMDQKVAQWLLKNMGYDATVAENGIEALHAAEEGDFDLIFMDIEMPEMDGMETTRKIRDRLPEEKQPVIIAMTAHALKGDREQYIEAGMDDYLSKPINEKKLAETLSRNVEGIAEPENGNGE